jgi:hypothetical protein
MERAQGARFGLFWHMLTSPVHLAGMLAAMAALMAAAMVLMR